ncbi:hypothetical protein FRC17_001056 [Serendipita sp. 399]|nr:hypothetical protein FRC17_001056 [Serendipita sp. 399]
MFFLSKSTPEARPGDEKSGQPKAASKHSASPSRRILPLGRGRHPTSNLTSLEETRRRNEGRRRAGPFESSKGHRRNYSEPYFSVYPSDEEAPKKADNSSKIHKRGHTEPMVPSASALVVVVPTAHTTLRTMKPLPPTPRSPITPSSGSLPLHNGIYQYAQKSIRSISLDNISSYEAYADGFEDVPLAAEFEPAIDDRSIINRMSFLDDPSTIASFQVGDRVPPRAYNVVDGGVNLQAKRTGGSMGTSSSIRSLHNGQAAVASPMGKRDDLALAKRYKPVAASAAASVERMIQEGIVVRRQSRNRSVEEESKIYSWRKGMRMNAIDMKRLEFIFGKDVLRADEPGEIK